MRLLKSSGLVERLLSGSGEASGEQRRGFGEASISLPSAVSSGARGFWRSMERLLSGFSLPYCSKKQNGRKVQEGRKVVTEGRYEYEYSYRVVREGELKIRIMV